MEMRDLRYEDSWINTKATWTFSRTYTQVLGKTLLQRLEERGKRKKEGERKGKERGRRKEEEEKREKKERRRKKKREERKKKKKRGKNQGLKIPFFFFFFFFFFNSHFDFFVFKSLSRPHFFRHGNFL